MYPAFIFPLHLVQFVSVSVDRIARSRLHGRGRPSKLKNEVLLLSSGRRLNGFLGLALNDRTILFLLILLVRKVSVG